MAKASSEFVRGRTLSCQESPVNTGDPDESALYWAERRVLEIQTKLHRWAGSDATRRFDDIFNLVCDPAFLLVAWARVAGNRGAKSSGIDGATVYTIRETKGVAVLLDDIRNQLKTGVFRPVPVRERMIPKPGTAKRRRLGIPTVTDRVVQAAMKLVLEPIFEADFHPCSYGFRPRRRAQDAIAEIHHLGSHAYHWVLEADIEACFDSIDHAALLARLRSRVSDKRVCALVKGFLKAGVLTELGYQEPTTSGTPQGGILSPLLANIALSALDEHFTRAWQMEMGTVAQREKRRRRGLGTWKLIRYADDFVVMVLGTKATAEALREEVASVLQPVGLRLSEAKTTVLHIDEGFDFLGFRIQRRRKPGTSQLYVYTYPSRKSVNSVKRTIRQLTRRTSQIPPRALLIRINSVQRGWCNYFRYGVSKRTFSYIGTFAWRRVTRWIRQRHGKIAWKHLKRRGIMNKGRVRLDGVELLNAETITVSRYRYRGSIIPTPWAPNSKTRHRRLTPT